MHFDYSHSFVLVNRVSTSFIDFFKKLGYLRFALDVLLEIRIFVLKCSAMISVFTNPGVDVTANCY